MTGGQEHKHTARSGVEQDSPEVDATNDLAERKEQIDADVDAILDEIDDVLEENAAEFVSSFVQKGGQ